jgi:hypothetical protein
MYVVHLSLIEEQAIEVDLPLCVSHILDLLPVQVMLIEEEEVIPSLAWFI